MDKNQISQGHNWPKKPRKCCTKIKSAFAGQAAASGQGGVKKSLNLQDMTMAAFAFSPSAGAGSGGGRMTTMAAKKMDKNNPAAGGVNSPLAGGNLLVEK